jgi:hypothetical protein
MSPVDDSGEFPRRRRPKLGKSIEREPGTLDAYRECISLTTHHSPTQLLGELQMSKKPTAPLAAIDSSSLATAAGGRRAAGSSRSRYGSEDAMLDALRDVKSALTEIGSRSNNGNNDMMMTMLMAKMMQGNQAPAAPQVINCGGGKRRGC